MSEHFEAFVTALKRAKPAIARSRCGLGLMTGNFFFSRLVSTAASILSILTRASAINRTCSGFAIATRATCQRSTVTMAAVLPVASSTM
ncbi:hypothetical protein WT61_27740 [Burkholderia stagnalis]|nr:hypothetical protein WT61_27740 [Burkholderia stagnalis]KWH46016.1 hypothetical protein WT62_15455 [Burkholderia stagnalis]